MRTLIIVVWMFGMVGTGNTQTSQENAQTLKVMPPPTATEAGVSLSEAYKSALKLVDASGARQAMAAQMDDAINQSKTEFIKKVPDADPEAADEWARRMKTRLNVEDFVAVIAKAYAAHFTASELDEIIQAGMDRKAGKDPHLSPGLTEKFDHAQVEMNSEVIDGCTQIGARLGGEIEAELRKEHPEWFKNSLPPAKP